MKGYFKKMNNGTWSFTIDVGKDPRTGRRKQARRSGFKTKKEAQRVAAELQTELSHGTYVNEQNVLFKDFAKEWLKIYERQNEVKKTTITVRSVQVDRLVVHLGNLKMPHITRNILQDAFDKLSDKYSYETNKGNLATCRLIFKKAVEMEVIRKNPSEYVRLKRKQRTIDEQDGLPKYLEKEELAHFLEMSRIVGLEGDPLIFSVLAYSGMRIGEMLALKWSDVNFDDCTVSITKTYVNPNNNNEYYLSAPKTKKSSRTIVLDETVMNDIRKHLHAQNKLKMLLRDTWKDEGFIFNKNDSSEPMTFQIIRHRMKRLLRLSKLNEELSPHSLRHTHTSLMAEAGVPLELIMERLGHADDQMTRNVYLHVTKEAKKEASDKFSELMRNVISD